MAHSRKHYDFDMMVSAGFITGHTFNHKFGAVPSMGNNQTGTIWDIDDTEYPWDALAVPDVINVERNDSSDNGLVVTVQGLDENFDYQSEDITISGANTLGTKLFKRVNRAFINGAAKNEGNIDIEAGGAGGTTVARITQELGQTLMGVYTVPRGKVAYIHRLTCSAEDNKDATGWMYVRKNNEDSTTNAFRVQHTWEVYGDGGQYHYDFAFPLKVDEKDDIDMRVTTRDRNGRYTIAFDILVVDVDE